MINLVSTLDMATSLDKTITGVGSQVSDVVRRQQIGGQIGGPIYGLAWGELSNMLNAVIGTSISNTPTFNERMYGYMFRLMAINKFEKDLTLSMIASGAYDNGNPDGIPFTANFPVYSNIVSDYPAFVRGAASNEFNGIDSTESTNKETLEVTNLYPDDIGVGTFNNKWNTYNRNSILTKTKKLFEQGKINSMISRFGTKADGEPDIDFNGKVGYSDLGMSRGRNLRKAGAYGTQYDTNGYNNPYCRVWTHHHQYDNYSKVIRPFIGEESLPSLDGPESSTIQLDKYQTIQKLHTWNNEFFKFKEGEDGDWGWKNNNSEWSHSVLAQQNGIVNITPKYNEKGSIHTKDCMFSIENLAWKDYDPYSFENALSWEQRGPLGGRIMWFPPYGISFTESTSVNWNESTFIGRGENVYTYSNTTRSGTLSFMMLTDHPSVTDYASWWGDKTTKVDDDVWHRFFAGCDSLDGADDNSLMHYVKPTPKDYMFETKEQNPSQKVDQINQDADENVPSDSVDSVSFFVFFPNNYSGVTDTPDFAVAYLLGGISAQKKDNSRDDIPINFETSLINEFKRGYEMDSEGITDQANEKNRIQGCEGRWHKGEEIKQYKVDPTKTWYYRIDGKYEIPKNENEKWINCYSQKLRHTPESYQDKNTNNFNLDVNKIPSYICNSKDKNNVYSFAEVAYAISNEFGKGKCAGVKEYLLGKLSEDGKKRSKELEDKLSNKIEKVTIIGYANSQGYPEANKLLAENRGKTISEWLKTYLGNFKVRIGHETKEISVNEEWKSEAKAYRSVKCTIQFATEETRNNNEESEEYTNADSSTIEGISRETGTEIETIIEELKKNGFLEGHDLNELKESDYKYMYDKLKKEENRVTKGTTSGRNKIRYDNEMFFYKNYQITHPLQWKALSDKLQYFDPAFHSMTPEGFNMRLTFLEQCTRQGDTMSASENGLRVASNMAFGRPPFCVLRLGDFYNQLIVIKSITKNYDTNGYLTWDLNDEGVGAQPMICNVTISFDFIGGGDLAGPVRRLQNAMSFNYYANASLYDNRADRMYYDSEEHLSTAMGGAGNDKPSLPEVGSDGKILDKKGTYSVLHSVEKNKDIKVEK